MTNRLPPILYVWHAKEKCFRPRPRFVALCDRVFGDGEIVSMVEENLPSDPSRRHYFAVIRQSFDNMPEDLAKRFPSQEHLRKWCLVHTGFFTEHIVHFESPQEAADQVAFIRERDPYSIIIVKGNLMQIRRAESQRKRVTNNERFQQQKTAVLNKISELLDVKPKDLKAEKGTYR